MPPKPFELSAHAAAVAEERGLKLEWIGRAIEQPLHTEKDRNNPALIHVLVKIPERGDRVLRVVYNYEIEPVRVVTAYFDRRQKGRL